MVYIESYVSTNINSFGNYYSKNRQSGFHGGFIGIVFSSTVESKFSDTSSIYQDGYASVGGAIFCLFCS